MTQASEAQTTKTPLPGASDERNGSGPLRERLDRTRRGVPSMEPAAAQTDDISLRDTAPRPAPTTSDAPRDAPSDDDQPAKRADDSSSDRPPRTEGSSSDRAPRERRSDRPPQPGGIDDLRASPLPPHPDLSAQRARPSFAEVVEAEPGQRRPLRLSAGQTTGSLPSRDGARAKSKWLPGVVLGTGVLFSMLVIYLFGSLPSIENAPEPPVDGTEGDVSHTAAPPAPTTAPIATPATAAAPGPAAPTAAPTPAPAADRYVLQVTSVPAGARVTAGGQSIVAPASLELGPLTAPLEVAAELPDHDTTRVTVTAAEFERKGDRYVRELAITLPSSVKTPPPQTARARAPRPPRNEARATTAPPARAQDATPQIAQPPVPIEPPAPTQEPATATVTPRPEPAGADASPPRAGAEQSPLERALACLSRGDNRCVIDTLEGRAKSERELVVLIETHLALGNASDAERHMRRYLSSYPDAKSAPKYQRWLERRDPSAEPAAPAP
jgi:hypothetical protein